MATIFFAVQFSAATIWGQCLFHWEAGAKIKYMQAIHAGSSTTASQWKRVLGHKQP